MQFLTNALMAFASVCIQIFKISFVQNLVVGFLVGIALYNWYKKMDDARSHNKNWTRLPGKIWCTGPIANVPKAVLKGQSPLEAIELTVYIDYPLSEVPLWILPQPENSFLIGKETVPNFPLDIEGLQWTVSGRYDVPKAPEGYVRERVEFIGKVAKRECQ